GAGVGLDPVESVQAAGAFREIAAFEAITDRRAQAYAWLDLDRSLARRATTLIAHDPIGWTERGITFRSIELWTGEIPMRADHFHLLPALPRLVSMAVQLVLFVAGVAGAALPAPRQARGAPERHPLRAPLRHADAGAVPLPGEDESRGEPVQPTGDSQRPAPVGIASGHVIGAIDGRAEELELADPLGVGRANDLGLLGMDGHRIERAAETEVVARGVLAYVAAPGRADDLRRDDAARAGETAELEPLRIADVEPARAEIPAQLGRRVLGRPLPARVSPRARLR